MNGATGIVERRKALPLVIWAYALVLALFLFWRLHDYLIQDTPSSQAYHSFNATRLSNLAAAVDGGAVGIVLLGDSRLRYATWRDEALAAAIAERLGRPVQVVRLVHDWGVFDDFAGLAPLVLQAQPALVVIQDELFAKERETQGRLLLGRSYLLWQAFGHGPWNPDGRDQAAYQGEQRCEVLADDDAQARKARVYLWVSFDPAGRNAKAMTAFAESVETGGAVVGVLSIPITSEGSAVLPGFERPRDAWSMPAPPVIADGDFCDVVHMNETGRANFSAWLIDAMIAHLPRDLR